MAASVLIVDDAPELRALLVPLLEAVGYAVRTAGDGDEALELARRHEPDVVVLDLRLPGLDGIEVCRRLRTFSDAYVIMLTARADERDRVLGLDVGADDFLAKPFSPDELLARIRAMLRRPRRSTTGALRRHGPLQIDTARRSVTVEGEAVRLTRTEFDLLEVLSRQPGAVSAREELRREVWGPNWYGDDHVVDVHVANLRKKIDRRDQPSLVVTVRGIGYRLRGADELDDAPGSPPSSTS